MPPGPIRTAPKGGAKAAASSKPAAADKPKPLSVKAMALYEKCLERAENNPEIYFAQEDCEQILDVPSGDAVLEFTTELTDIRAFKVLTLEGNVVFRVRAKNIVKILKDLSKEEVGVYSTIEDTGRQGIWAKNLKTKTGASQASITKHIKTLETKKLIKPIQNSKAPAKKVYLLYHLEPADDVAGGPFFDKGELDSGLVFEVSRIVRIWIQMRSWQFVNLPIPPSERPSTTAELRRHQEAIYTSGGGKPGKSKFRPPPSHRRTALPFPPSYDGYPRTEEVLEMIVTHQLIQNVNLTAQDVRALLDSMVYEGLLEHMGEDAYRAARPELVWDNRATQRLWADIEDLGNGFTQAPCSRCPVFNLCEDGGPVSASNCEYYERWLRPEANNMVKDDNFWITQGMMQKREARAAALKAEANK